MRVLWKGFQDLRTIDETFSDHPR